MSVVADLADRAHVDRRGGGVRRPRGDDDGARGQPLVSFLRDLVGVAPDDEPACSGCGHPLEERPRQRRAQEHAVGVREGSEETTQPQALQPTGQRHQAHGGERPGEELVVDRARVDHPTAATHGTDGRAALPPDDRGGGLGGVGQPAHEGDEGVGAQAGLAVGKDHHDGPGGRR